MGASHRDDKSRAQAPLHLFSNSDDVVGPGAGVTRCTEVVVQALAPKVQLYKFSSIGVPLEDNAFCPVMPERRAHNKILIDENVVITIGIAARRVKAVSIECRESVPPGVAI